MASHKFLPMPGRLVSSLGAQKFIFTFSAKLEAILSFRNGSILEIR